MKKLALVLALAAATPAAAAPNELHASPYADTQGPDGTLRFFKCSAGNILNVIAGGHFHWWC